LLGGLKPQPPLQKLGVVLETGCETLRRAWRRARRLLAVGTAGYADDVPNAGYCDGRWRWRSSWWELGHRPVSVVM